MDANTAGVRDVPVGPARVEGDPLPSLTASDAEFVDALRSALTPDPTAVGRPGQLRQKIEAQLGADDAARLRPLVHQVVAAAEENLPGYLTRIMPLTAQSLQKLSGELATARGWNDATARRVTQIWAHALGFSGVAEGWPSGSPAPTAAEGLTALPVDPALVSPSPVVAAPPSPSSAPQVAPQVALPATPQATPWPTPRGRLAKRHPASSTGEPTLGVVRGYSGMSLQLYIAIVSAFVVLVGVSFVMFHVLVGALPILLLAFVMRRALADGALVATAHGLEFTPYSPLGGKPKGPGFAAPWSEVTVTDGAFSACDLAGRTVQVGPFNRQFTRAALAYAGREA